MILIDSGNTHNFVGPTIVKRSKFPICVKKNMRVRMANGDQLFSKGKKQGVKYPRIPIFHGSFCPRFG